MKRSEIDDDKFIPIAKKPKKDMSWIRSNKKNSSKNQMARQKQTKKAREVKRKNFLDLIHSERKELKAQKKKEIIIALQSKNQRTVP